MTFHNLPCVLSIAGTDPCGGAGLNADIKTISATGAYAATVITAVVAQNTQGVDHIHVLDAKIIVRQLQSVFDDMNVNVIKIGMLHDDVVIENVGDLLNQYSSLPIVFDPVMVAKDGSTLLNIHSFEKLESQILKKSYLITPNIVEAEILLNKKIDNKNKMIDSAISLSTKYNTHVLLKGGHLQSTDASDLLFDIAQGSFHWFSSPRINTINTHGTGCTLSSAIASYLAQGLSLLSAVQQAKEYITKAIDGGRYLKLGKGNGPVDHFYFLENRHENI